MGDSRRIGEENGGEKRQGAGGAGKGDSATPEKEEEGTPIHSEDESGKRHLPESEEDSGAIERGDEELVQSWPGKGGPGTFPPPG